jgi:hypothetical protein
VKGNIADKCKVRDRHRKTYALIQQPGVYKAIHLKNFLAEKKPCKDILATLIAVPMFSYSGCYKAAAKAMKKEEAG